MQQLRRMHVLDALEELVNYVLLVDFFQNISTNDCVQVGVHEIEYQIYILVVLCSDYVLETNNIFMSSKFLQKNDFPKRPLRIGCILKGIKVFLERNNFFSSLVDSFPDDAVCALAFTILNN